MNIQEMDKKKLLELAIECMKKDHSSDISIWCHPPYDGEGRTTEDYGNSYAIISFDIFSNERAVNKNLPEAVGFGAYHRECTRIEVTNDDESKVRKFLNECLEECESDKVFVQY